MAAGMSETTSPYQQLRSQLAYLRLEAMAEALPGLLEEAQKEKLTHTAFLTRLLGREVEVTEQRRLSGRMRFACLPAPWTFDNFDFDAQPSLDRKLVEDLASLRFIEEAANVLLIGPPGVGKTHISVALGHAAVKAGYRVYYTTAADLAARCHRAALMGRWDSVMRSYAQPSLLIVDELGYLALPTRPPRPSSRSSAVATSRGRSSSPPTAPSPTGARSSRTPWSRWPCSIAYCIDLPSSIWRASPTACELTGLASRTSERGWSPAPRP